MRTYAVELVGLKIIKIGRTSNLRQRLHNLNRYAPYSVRLIGVLDGDRELECHARFGDDRIRFEWFKDTRRIRRFFTKNTDYPKLPNWEAKARANGWKAPRGWIQ